MKMRLLTCLALLLVVISRLVARMGPVIFVVMHMHIYAGRLDAAASAEIGVQDVFDVCWRYSHC